MNSSLNERITVATFLKYFFLMVTLREVSNEILEIDMLRSLSKINFLHVHNANATRCRALNANTAAIVKTARAIAPRTYPTRLVEPNGSTVMIRYHEPRRIIRLPLDISGLSEDERRVVMEKRKPKKVVKIEEQIEDTFNAGKYLSYVKKSKKS